MTPRSPRCFDLARRYRHRRRNSYYRTRCGGRGALGAHRVLDAGTSGGVWGLENGIASWSAGRNGRRARAAGVRDLSRRPTASAAWRAGGRALRQDGPQRHRVRDAAVAGRGIEILHASEFGLDLPQIAEVWRYGSVVRSWLLDLLSDALKKDPASNTSVDGSTTREGRWTAPGGDRSAVPAPALADALFARFRSRQADSFSARAIAALRNEFGGHAVKKS